VDRFTGANYVREESGLYGSTGKNEDEDDDEHEDERK
jgi:hypothetical protein